MVKHRPFTRTEMKILVYNKMKQGKSYERAKKEVEEEVFACIKNSRKEEKFDEKNTNCKFKEDFKKLKDGKAKDN